MKTPYNWAKRDQIHRLLRMLDKEVTGKSETHKSHRDFPDEFEVMVAIRVCASILFQAIYS